MKCQGVPGLRVTLRVDGTDLPEYHEIQSVAGVTQAAENYVEAVLGSKFDVYLEVDRTALGQRPPDHLSCEVFLDGKFVTSRRYRHVREAHAIEGVKDTFQGSVVIRRFQFAELATVDTTDGLDEESIKKKYKSLGQIRVDFRWVRKDGAIQQQPIPGKHLNPSKNIETVKDRQNLEDIKDVEPKQFQPAFDSAIPEKALKGRSISSFATLGEPEQIPRVSQQVATSTSTSNSSSSGRLQAESTEALEPLTSIPPPTPKPDRARTFPYGRVPFARFTFKYRSRKDLRDEYLIPRSPPPVPLEHRDPDTLTLEEARELTRRMKEQLNAQAQVKREKREYVVVADETANEDSEVVFVHDDGDRRKRQRVAPNDSGIEIVDLCDG